MTAKEYLGNIHKWERRIRRDRERINDLRQSASGLKGVSYDSDRVSTSGVKDHMAEIIVQYADLVSVWHEELIQLEAAKDRVIRMIHEMDDGTEEARILSDVLFYRYVLYLEWDDIADKLFISSRHCLRLHGSALQMFEEKYRDILNHVT